MGIPYLSKRWEMVFLLFTGILCVYTLRVNMSVAVQDMRDDLNWTETEKGLALSSFYWGYAIGQIPGSILAARYGAKWLFGFGSLGACLVIRALIGFTESATFPCVYHYIPIWIPLSEKTFMIPAILSGMYMGEIIGFSLSGILVGSDITINGEFYGGWPSVFYIFGLVGMLWFPMWAYFARELPENHLDISREELRLIRKGKNLGDLQTFDQLDSLRDEKEESNPIGNPLISHMHISEGLANHHNVVDDPESFSGVPATASGNTEGEERAGRQISLISVDGIEDKAELSSRKPWKHIFTHPASLTLFLNGWVSGWIGFTLLSEMPSYLTDVLGFNLEHAGILSVFPFMALYVSSLSFGRVFNYMQTNYGWEVRTVRQVAQYIALGGSSLMLIICAFLDDKYAAYFFMILALFMYGATVASLSCAYSDCSPNYSPIMNTVGNTIEAIAGITGPIVVAGFIEAYPGVEGWRGAFFLTASMACVALTCWSLFQTSEIVPELNNPRHVD